MKDLVSVVIPAYNAAGYLEACLNAVCAQSYTNLEVIIINDGSTAKLQYLCDKANVTEDLINKAADYICVKHNWDDVVSETLKVY